MILQDAGALSGGKGGSDGYTQELDGERTHELIGIMEMPVL